MVASILMNSRNTDTIPLFGAQRLPSTSQEIRSSSYDSAMLNDRFDSEDIARERGFDVVYDPFYARIREANPSFRTDGMYAQSKRFFNQPSPALGGKIAYTNAEAKHALVAEEAAKLNIPFPSFREAYDKAQEQGVALAQDSYEKYQQDILYTISPSPRLNAAMGAVGPTVTDPLVLGSVIATLPMGVTALALKTAAVEATVAMAAEVPIQMKRQNWYAQQGREVSTGEQVANVMMAAGASGIIGGGVSLIYKAVGGRATRIMPSYDGGPAGMAAKIDQFQQAWPGTYVTDTGGRAFYQPMTGPPRETAAQIRIRTAGSAENPLKFDLTNDPAWTGAGSSFETAAATGESVVVEGLQGFTGSSPYSLSVLYDDGLARVFPSTGPERNYGVAFAQEERMWEMNPAMGSNQLDPAQQLDSYHFTLNNYRMKEAHLENMTEAMAALSRGNMPSPTNMKELSLHLNITDPVARMSDVRKLLAPEGKFNPKSRVYRETVKRIVRNSFAGKWQQNIEELRHLFPADGKPLKVQTPRPRVSIDDAAARWETAHAELETLQAKMQELRREMAMARRAASQYNKAMQAGAAGPQPRAVNAITKEQEANLKAQAKARSKAEKNSAILTEHENYSLDKVQTERTNMAMQAEQLIARMDNGKMPRSGMIGALRKATEEALESAHKAVKQGELALDDIVQEGAFRAVGRSDKELINVNSFIDRIGNTPAAKVMQKKVDEATVAQFEALPETAVADVTLDGNGNVSGTQSVAKVKEEISEMDGVVEAFNTCGISS